MATLNILALRSTSIKNMHNTASILRGQSKFKNDYTAHIPTLYIGNVTH